MIGVPNIEVIIHTTFFIINTFVTGTRSLCVFYTTNTR